MIQSFGDKIAEKIWNGETNIKGFDSQLVKRTYKKLYEIHISPEPEALKFPPSNHLEALVGDFKGFWSIRINDKYRLIFRFEGSKAFDVRVSKHYQ
jgi:Plasmid maintenance system killer protein